jgi:ornithine cyclodeaminase/alanine dehydrogenase-like protein (mu-crystallin family)
MVLVIPPSDHTALLSFPEAIEVIEQAYRAWGQEPSLNVLRHIVNERIRLAVHPASVPFLGAAGLMAHTRHLGPSLGTGHHAASLIFDLETGALDAILLEQIACGPPIAGVTDIRTAATSAVAMKYLTRADAERVGILGSGRQAQSHLIALATIRKLRSAKVYSRSPANRESYAHKMTKALGIPVEAVSRAEGAVRDVDIVLVMTDTKEPVLFGEWLKPGQHVTSVMGGNTPRDSLGQPVQKPRRDLDDEALRRSDIIVINSRAQAQQDFQGDIMLPIERGVLTWERVQELGELLAGKVSGKTDARQITLYKNNGGQGVADVALATLAAKKAREKGLGTEI